jgi:hypothetical protein
MFMEKSDQFITTQEQLKKFLHAIDVIVDEYHPHIYLNNDVFEGLNKIHDAVNKQIQLIDK